ncbi:MAG: hypothetical protein WCC95_18030 [Candidatus Sulfotelmatobacter sp.]
MANVSSGSTTVSDDQNGAWTVVTPAFGNSRGIFFAYFLNTVGGVKPTVSYTSITGATASEFFIAEYSGVALTSALDQVASHFSSSNSNTAATGNITYGTAGELVVAAGFNNTGSTISNGTIDIRQNPNTVEFYGDDNNTATSPFNASVGFAASVAWGIAAITFKPVASSGGGNNNAGLLRLLGVN